VLHQSTESNFFCPGEANSMAATIGWTMTKARDALMPSDGRMDALSEHGTMSSSRGFVRVDAHVVVGGTRWMPACLPHLACNHGLRHRRQELLPANSWFQQQQQQGNAESQGGFSTSTIEAVSGFHSVHCSPNLAPRHDESYTERHVPRFFLHLSKCLPT
jgi:hypothetical protein